MTSVSAGTGAERAARPTAGSAGAQRKAAERDSAAARRQAIPGALVERLACPSCMPANARLTLVHEGLVCSECRATYPLARVLERPVPWLFADPGMAHLGWSARLKGFLRDNTAQFNRLNRAKFMAAAGSLAERRIAKTMHALREHRRHVLAILEPVWLDENDLEAPATAVLNDRLPRNQGLSSYAANLFRDWAWNNGENEALLDSVSSLLDSAGEETRGAVVTLGSGAGRLPYDLHVKYAPALSVALDLNPLLTLVATQMIAGESLSLHEFPTAPRPGAESGVLNTCRAPVALQPGAEAAFSCVLGDATRAPFAPGSFDVAVTPWLIDIVADEFGDFAAKVNRLLATGGLWVNSGSCVFRHSDPLRRYTEKEVLEKVSKSGFEVVSTDSREIPYLQSPHSSHGRIERVYGFAARKRSDVAMPFPAPALPAWILDTTEPVPQTDDFVVSSTTHLLNAQVLAAIDGKRSIKMIAKLVAREYNLGLDECELVIQRILMGDESS